VNLKLLGCIAMGVFVAHLAIFMMVFRVRSMSQPSAPVHEPPNFRVAEEIVVDPATRTKVINREITVSTKLRSDLYQGKAAEPARK
jgi:hypothetical protein